MAQVRTDAVPWIHQRCCPRCGYAGWEIQRLDERTPYHCPNCDEDLYARLPLTYAEREGLVQCTGCVRHPAVPAGPRRSLLVRILAKARRFLASTFRL